MVDYEKAKALALACWSEVDYCVEHEDAFVFSKKDDMSFGGSGPVVVLKEDGACVNMPWYLIKMDGGSSPVVREGYIADLG